MSHREFSIHCLSCDEPECGELFQPKLVAGYGGFMAPAESSIKATAHEAGWSERDGQDFCPHHATN